LHQCLAHHCSKTQPKLSSYLQWSFSECLDSCICLQSHANSMEIFMVVDAGALWHSSLFMFTQPLLGYYQ
jgi:hypothetical protein